jgi:hypothetical protein
MAEKRYALQARVSTDKPAAVRPVLARLVPRGSVTPGEQEGELRVEAEMEGASARELNRLFLSELRRAARKTRLRAEWTCGGVTERFFDYVPKGTRRA